MTGRIQPGPEIIRTGTELRSMPLLPEIRLHQAGDPISMWQQTEQAAGRDDLDPPFWAFPWAGGPRELDAAELPRLEVLVARHGAVERDRLDHAPGAVVADLERLALRVLGALDALELVVGELPRLARDAGLLRERSRARPLLGRAEAVAADPEVVASALNVVWSKVLYGRDALPSVPAD